MMRKIKNLHIENNLEKWNLLKLNKEKILL